MRTATAKTIVRLIEDNVFLLFGVPKNLISDNGRQFVSRDFKKLMDIYHVTHFRTPTIRKQIHVKLSIGR